MGGLKSDKGAYFSKLKSLLEEYRSVFIVTVDNVSSQQMHQVRQALREEAVVLMGKNTMVSSRRDIYPAPIEPTTCANKILEC